MTVAWACSTKVKTGWIRTKTIAEIAGCRLYIWLKMVGRGHNGTRSCGRVHVGSTRDGC